MIVELEPGFRMKDYPIDIKFIERPTEKAEDGVFFVRRNETEIFIVNNGELTVKTENSSYTIVAGQGVSIRNNVPRQIITSEKEYAKMKKEKVDPRLEVLKKYKEES